MNRFGLVAALVLVGCPAPGMSTRTDEVVTHPDEAPIAPFEECTVYTATERAIARDHREVCSTLTYASHPPAGGSHYGQWAAFGLYDAPVPWPFLVHSLEHGAVVLAYRCEPGAECDALRAALEGVITDFGTDELCRDADFPSRFVLVPDPDLEWAFAAVAWEHVYLATCFDRTSLDDFVSAHYGQAPEDLCFPGLDRSASGWCP